MSHLSRPNASGSQPPAFDRTSKLVAVVIGLLSVIAGLAMGLRNPFLHRVASAEGARIDTLFNITLGITTTIFVIVHGFLLYAILRFSRRRGDESDGLPFRSHTLLEAAWTAIPALVVVFIGILSYQVLADIERPSKDALVVEVKGVQYAWEFRYPDAGLTTSELHIPLNRQVLLKLHSDDVIHSFWVPDLRIKKDVMPDRVTRMNITGIEPGAYPIVCTELCGAGHAIMRAQLVVESDAEFQAWIAGQQSAAAAAASGAPDVRTRGRLIFTQNGCDACHTLDDAGAAGTFGPDLSDIAAHAATHVPGQSAEEYLRLAITKPNAFVDEDYPPDVMPQDYGLRISEPDLAELIKYLMEMK